MAFLLLLVIVAIVGLVAWVKAKQRRERAEQDRREGVFAVFSGLRLSSYGELIVGYSDGAIRHRVTGMTARCETSGSVNRVKGNRVDDRSVTLTVESPGFIAVREVPMRHNPSAGVDARVFASQVNTAGQRTYPLRVDNSAALQTRGSSGSLPGRGGPSQVDRQLIPRQRCSTTASRSRRTEISLPPRTHSPVQPPPGTPRPLRWPRSTSAYCSTSGATSLVLKRSSDMR
ncbi:MAG: hypothetical protein QOG20_5391 [Pseudonocardiales bacterium]|jgi:hypothetical protein|nr:hypothetical protein [Pseudonocardiales bacterium]